MKLLIDTHYLLWMFMDTEKNSFLLCRALENEELVSSYHLPKEHKDPFDRIMIWQAIKNNMVFLSVDSKMEKYAEYGLKLF